MCPNFGSEGYILQKDPWTQNVGTNLNFVVNFCSVSAQRQNITDSGCMTNSTEQYKYIDKTRVQHKFVYKYFNPYIWLKEKVMDFTSDFKMQSDF